MNFNALLTVLLTEFFLYETFLQLQSPADIDAEIEPHVLRSIALLRLRTFPVFENVLKI